MFRAYYIKMHASKVTWNRLPDACVCNEPYTEMSSGKTGLTKASVLYIGSAVPLETAIGIQSVQMPCRERYTASIGPDMKVAGIDATLTVYSSGITMQVGTVSMTTSQAAETVSLCIMSEEFLVWLKWFDVKIKIACTLETYSKSGSHWHVKIINRHYMSQLVSPSDQWVTDC